MRKRMWFFKRSPALVWRVGRQTNLSIIWRHESLGSGLLPSSFLDNTLRGVPTKGPSMSLRDVLKNQWLRYVLSAANAFLAG
jgi:hypothetical protein